MATGRTNTISHIIYATEWNHVNVAYIAAVEDDGDKFERPTERMLESDAVLKAARALEDAVRRELSKHEPKAQVLTLRQVRDARQKELEATGVASDEARSLAMMPQERTLPSPEASSSTRKAGRKSGARKRK